MTINKKIKNIYSGPKCAFCKDQEDIFKSYNIETYIKECILDVGRIQEEL
jgi:hypothetical protein